MYYTKRNKYNCFKFKYKKKEENDHWLKFEIWTLKIYIRIIKHYTDIDPTVDIRTQVNRNFTTSTFLFLGYLDEP